MLIFYNQTILNGPLALFANFGEKCPWTTETTVAEVILA